MCQEVAEDAFVIVFPLDGLQAFQAASVAIAAEWRLSDPCIVEIQE